MSQLFMPFNVRVIELFLKVIFIRTWTLNCLICCMHAMILLVVCHPILAVYTNFNDYQKPVIRVANHNILKGCCNMGYTYGNHLKLKSCLLINYLSVVKSFWNFAQSMAVALPCSVQNLKMIWQPKWMLWMNKFLQDLSLRWVWEGYPILWQALR